MSESDVGQKELCATDHNSEINAVKQQLKKSNQIYVVPFGILSVFLTLYLTASAFKQTLGLSQTKLTEANKHLKELQRIETVLPLQEAREKESLRRKLITDKLLEHSQKCYDLEIFTKVIDLSEYEKVFKNVLSNSMYGAKIVEKERRESEVVKKKTSGLFLSAVKNGNNGKTQKRLNGKNNNGLKYNNKSIKAKNGRKKVSQKKEIVQKKGSTAEPIIYLFALVFIYLLLKAASDINQHYKSQSKGDKRLRRCSLQSYAQAHKPDRRASKESPINIKHMLDTRSKSVDRYSSTNQLARKNEILIKLRKCTSVDEQQHQHEIQSLAWNFNMDNNMTTSTPTECVDTINSRTMAYRRDSMFVLPISSSRRCSVPVSLNYQRIKLTTTPSITMSATARRTSISSGGMGPGGSIESVDSQFPEVKRRVRMINRH